MAEDQEWETGGEELEGADVDPQEAQEILLQNMLEIKRENYRDSQLAMMDFADDLEALWDALGKTGLKKITDLQKKWRPAFRFMRDDGCNIAQERELRRLNDLLQQFTNNANHAQALKDRHRVQMTMFPGDTPTIQTTLSATLDDQTNSTERGMTVGFTNQDSVALQKGAAALREGHE